MKYWVCGYGQAPEKTIALWDFESEKTLWSYEALQPSWLYAGKTILLATNELEGDSFVTAFVRNTENDWQPAGRLRVNGSYLCHLNMTSNDSLLAGACYGNGYVFTVKLTPNGQFGEILGSDTQAQAGKAESNAHYVCFEGDYLFAVNLGLDCVIRYKTENGKLEEKDRLHLPDGSGPRHLCFAPGIGRFYCVSEYSNQLFVIKYSSNSMELLQSHSTLDDNYNGRNDGSGICRTRDGRFIYTGNRGANTVACFSLGPNGDVLGKARQFSCFGDWPRHIALTDDDKYIAVANEKSNQVVFLPRNPENGSLGEPAKVFEHSQPNYVGEVI